MKRKMISMILSCFLCIGMMSVNVKAVQVNEKGETKAVTTEADEISGGVESKTELSSLKQESGHAEVKEEELTPIVSNNIGDQNYINWGRWSSPVKSYLMDHQDGTMTRVEYTSDGIAVEKWNTEGELLEQRILPIELSLFGGFYAGEDYNFVVFGQKNPEEDDSTEVIRVVRYSKEWERLDHVGLYGANTVGPFEAGSLRMVQYGDMLYVRTSHKMYASSDGLNHQANLTFSVQISTMTITDQYSIVMNVDYGYVSHSFNQFIDVNGSELAAVDHGDAYPRAVVLIRYGKAAGDTTFTGRCSSVNVLNIQGTIGANDTGVSVGGFEVSDSSYLVVGNSVVQDENYSASGVRNIFVTSTPTDNFTEAAAEIHWITSYEEDSDVSVSNPQFVKISKNQFLLLWTEGDILKYVYLDGHGNTVSRIYEMEAALSDCKPIVADGMVTWYCTNNSAPVFYTIDAVNPETPTSGTCGETVSWTLNEDGTLVISGTGAMEDYESGQDVPWYSLLTKIKAVTVEDGITEIGSHVFGGSRLTGILIPESVTRIGEYAFQDCGKLTEIRFNGDAPQIEANAFWGVTANVSYPSYKNGWAEAAGNDYGGSLTWIPIETPFTDVNQSAWYYSTVKEAYELGLMTGTTSTTFAPNSPMTRAMATAVLYRISGSPAVTYEPIFADVEDGKYYSKCVTWAAKNKVVNGYAADNTFRPNANVTREQMAVILYNYAKFRGLDVSVQADLSSFNDASQISSYARTAMSWAVGNKLMSGTLEGNLNPKNEATRAECAKMLLQVYKLIETGE